MGNLSKWIEDKKTADINSSEYDITTNKGMRELFFKLFETLPATRSECISPNTSATSPIICIL